MLPYNNCNAAPKTCCPLQHMYVQACPMQAFTHSLKSRSVHILAPTHQQPPSPSARKGEDDLRSDRDNLAAALERLADVQRELAEAQRNLMTGQKQLASQQAQMVSFVTSGSGDGSADGSVGVHRRG